jgi:crossover junction endodeoxyribonuclease RusA
VLTHEIRAVIPGHPAPKGSLKCVGGPKGRGHRLVEDNARTGPWREKIAGWLRKEWPADRRAADRQPVGAEVTVSIERPAGHYGTGRNAAVLKASAPRYPVSHATGDVDKHARLTLDALQDAGVLPDDCIVVELNVRKAYVGCPWTPDALGHAGVVIRVFPMQEPGDR